VTTSGRVWLFCVYAATLVGALAIVLLFVRLWLISGLLGLLWIGLLVLVGRLLRGVDREELARSNQRYVETWARGMAKASGAWEPRTRQRNRSGDADSR
jgi:hypothetical protein